MLKARWLAALCFVAAVVPFSPAIGYPFFFLDDPLYVTENPHVLQGLTLDNVRWAFGAHDQLWGPLTWLSLQLDATLFGVNPAGYHLENILWHGATTAIVFLAALKVLGEKHAQAALVGSLLFAWHPLRLESVVWVTERKDVLSGCLGLLACLVFVGDKPRRFLLTALVALAVLSKQTMVTLPLLLALLALALGPERRALRRLVSDLAPSAVVVLVLVVAQLVIVRANDGIAVTSARDWVNSVADIPRRYLMYGLNTALPHDLTVLSWRRVPTAASIALSLAALGALVSALWWWRRRLAEVVWGLSWFAISLLPAIGLLPVGYHDIADRFTYLGHAALWPALAAFGARQLGERPVLLSRLAAGGALSVYLSMTLARLPLWADSLGLVEDGLRLQPDNAKLLVARGGLLLGRGQWAEACASYAAAEPVLAGPGFDSEYAIALAEAGNWAGANLRFARDEARGQVEAYLNHAKVLANHQRVDEAIAVLEAVKGDDGRAAALLTQLRAGH